VEDFPWPPGVGLVELTSSGVVKVTPSFRFHVIGDDPDDNLFTIAPSRLTRST
jgi:hypothetical protein